MVKARKEKEVDESDLEEEVEELEDDKEEESSKESKIAEEDKEEEEEEEEDSREGGRKFKRVSEMSPEEKQEYRHKEKDRRKRAKVRAQIEAAQMRNEIAALRDELHKTQKRVTEVDMTSVKSEMQQLEQDYSAATIAYEEAVNAGDGKESVKALNARERITRRYEYLNAQQREQATQTKAATPEVNPRVKRLAQEWAVDVDFDDWSDREKKIALEIDKELTSEKYDPTDPSYFDELNDRLQEVMPHKFNKDLHSQKNGVKSGSRPRISGAGKEAPSKDEDIIRRLPKNLIENAKATGAWDDPKRRAKVIANYKAEQALRKGN